MTRVKTPAPMIAEDRPFQERFWKAERFAWIAFALVLVAALLGVFGSGGPFSQTTVASGENTIDYPRSARWEASDEVAITLAGRTGERSLTFSENFAAAFEIEDIQPTPDHVKVDGGSHRYVFSSVNDGPAKIRFTITPRRPDWSHTP